jgi:thiamine-monophosphate kinase
VDNHNRGWDDKYTALASLGERRLVADVLADRYKTTQSFGDDCAVIPELPSWPFELVATTDPCPEPLVALLGFDDRMYWQGWLLATINLSDLAAAGAVPLGLLVSYLLPEGTRLSEFRRLIDGVDDCCREHDCAVIGGNLGDAASVQLTATAIGACRSGRRLSRRGASPGDALLLVGAPGYLWSTALLKEGYAGLDPASERAVFDRALRPMAQLRAGQLLAARDDVHAAIDISDGLYPSVQSLCSLSDVGAVIVADAPVLDPLPLEVCRQADVDPFAMVQLWGDWTLLVAVDSGAAPEIAAELRAAGVGCATIGHVLSEPGTFLDRAGQRARWRGVDAERFTESSWSKTKLRDYLTGLIQPGPRG